MKTIQFTESKSVDVKFSFKVMQKLYLVSGINDFNDLTKWAQNPINWGKLIQAVSVKEIKEVDAINLIDEANSVNPVFAVINEMAEHVKAFYTIETKEENVPNG